MTSSTIPIELPGQVGFLATATLCMVLPTALVVLRILARRRTSLSLNGSDFCIVAALVCHPSQAPFDFYWPSCPVTTRVKNAVNQLTISFQVFDIGLCIVDYFMVLEGGFGFHIKDIERRFGPATLVTFNKVRYETYIRPFPKQSNTACAKAYTNHSSV